jgi:serine/threonine-protein kinase
MPSRRRRALLIAVPALVALAVAWALVRPRKETLPPKPNLPNSLAVLPFRNLSAQPGGQLIGDGLVETVSARLAGLPGLQVVTPTAVVAAADRDSEVYGIARRVGANLLLQGTFQRERDKIRITYAVVNTVSRESITAGALDGSASDLFLLQDRLVEIVSQALKIPRRAPRTPRPAGLEGAGAQERYVQAIGYLQRYDRPSSVDEAARLLEGLARGNPSSAIVQAALGRAYLARFNLTRDAKWLGPASAAGERARQLDPGSPEVSSTLGELYLRTGKAADAVTAYERALASQPNNFDATLGLARAYDAADDGVRSEKTYKRAIVLQPAHFGGYSKLAGFYFNRGRWDAAAKAFRKVTQLTPDNARAFANLGACYFQLGQFGGALEAFEKSVALEPTDLAWSNIGTVQYYLGRYGDSAAAFEKALTLLPTHFENWANLGDALRLIPGREAKATQAYEKGIELARAELVTNPDDVQARSYLALCLAKTGKAAEAREHLRRALPPGPDRPELLFNAAIVANRGGKPAEAVAYLARAVRAGFNPAIIRNEPELANLRNRDDFEIVLRQHPEASSR